MTNDDRWLLAVVIVDCAAAAMVVIDGSDSCGRRRQRRGARGEGDTGEGGRGREGKGKASEGQRVRADEGTWARAMVDMADNNSKQQDRVSDDGTARRRTKINEIGVTIPTCFLMLMCAHWHPKISGSRVIQLKIADASKPH